MYLYTRRGEGRAVNGVSFDVNRGETLGLVGEWGCGKSLTALSLIGLHPQPPAKIVEGQVLFDGVDLTTLPPEKLRTYRGKRIAMISPGSDDRLSTPCSPSRIKRSRALATAPEAPGPRAPNQARHRGSQHCICDYTARPKPRGGALGLGITPTSSQRRDAPACGGGGDRPLLQPRLLIADEPTTSLDVTVQAAYIALLKDIQNEVGFLIIFVTHDFGIVAKLCDRVAVMYAGRIVETAPTASLFAHPAHPYTEALLSSVPDVRERPRRLTSIEGAPPRTYDKTTGCAFASRCAYVMERCRESVPRDVEVAPRHQVSGWKHG